MARVTKSESDSGAVLSRHEPPVLRQLYVNSSNSYAHLVECAPNILTCILASFICVCVCQTALISYLRTSVPIGVARGCSGCTCTPRAVKNFFRRNLQGICVPPGHEVHPQPEQESIFRTFFAGRVRFGGIFRKKVVNCFDEKVHPPDKILATPMSVSPIQPTKIHYSFDTYHRFSGINLLSHFTSLLRSSLLHFYLILLMAVLCNYLNSHLLSRLQCFIPG